MKINSTSAYSFLQHTKLLAYLSGKEEAEQLQKQAASYEGEEIYKKLLRIENQMHRLSERECNGEIENEQSQPQWDNAENKIKELLPRLQNFGGFFFNGDPRGFAIKIKEEVKEKIYAETGFRMYSDLGGYGILAPEF
ncbi:MAG TPA: hypothetical protein PKI55_06355 [Chitinophagaceae bacterium]|nr:hypothetical protein [Chitinophagaceae bacterium]